MESLTRLDQTIVAVIVVSLVRVPLLVMFVMVLRPYLYYKFSRRFFCVFLMKDVACSWIGIDTGTDLVSTIVLHTRYQYSTSMVVKMPP